MLDVPHFQESGRQHPTSPDDRMSIALYAAALDYLVIACVDIVFTHQSNLLLAKRNTAPRASWWIVGGRMAAGETPVQTAQRKARQEAQLANLAASRFRCLGVYSTCFASRQQPPQQHGLHSINLTYWVDLTTAEAHQLHLRSDEYDTWQWLDLPAAMALLNPDDAIDQALLHVIHDLQTANRHR